MAKGEKIDDIIKSMVNVAEGVQTSESVHELAKQLSIDVPICEQVYLCIHKNKSLSQALEDLQNRPLRAEFDQIEIKTN